MDNGYLPVVVLDCIYVIRIARFIAQLDTFTKDFLLCRRGAMVAHHLPMAMECYSQGQVGVAGSTPVDGTLLPGFFSGLYLTGNLQ
jgi:hypothetical protein